MKTGLALMLGIAAAAALAVAAPARAVDVSGTNRLTFEVACDIWIANADGGSPRRLTDTPETCEERPAWSPDGMRIAYQGRHGITIVNRDGTGTTVIPGTQESYEPAWSPNGARIAFTRINGLESNVYTVGIDGSGLTQVTNSPLREGSPAYTPGGALTFVRSGIFEGQPSTIMFAGGREVSTTFFGVYTDLEWNPFDGRLLATFRAQFVSDVLIIHDDFSGDPFIQPLAQTQGRDFTGSWRADAGAAYFESNVFGPGIYLEEVEEPESHFFAPTKLLDTEALEAASVNTEPGENVTIQPVDPATGASPVTLTFPSVTEGGRTAVTSAPDGPAPPESFSLGSPPVYYDVQTSAEYEGPITICISRTGVLFDGEPRLFHFEDEGWVDVTTSVSAAEVCGEVAFLSPFALFAPADGDVTAPTVTASALPEPNAAGWNRSNVTVTLTGADEGGGSGMRELVYSLGGDPVAVAGAVATIELADEGLTTLEYFARDNAGNESTPQTLVVRIDMTAPALVGLVDVAADAVSPAGAPVAYAVSATDALDGAPATSCSPASGSTFAIGDTAVSCTTADVAGNEATGGFTVHVRGAAEQLEAMLAGVESDSELGKGARAALTARLRAILASLDRGNTCHGLASLAVLAGALPAISDDRRATLLAAAARIGTVLACE